MPNCAIKDCKNYTKKFKKKHGITYHRWMTAMALWSLAALVSAQVTFSRDWSGGKRAPPAVFDCGQFARLCRHFLHELKQEMSQEDKLTKRRQPERDEQLSFDDEK